MIGTTWLLAREVAGRTAAWFAAALVAVPPVVLPGAVAQAVGAVHRSHPVRLAVPDVRGQARLAAHVPARHPLERGVRRCRRSRPVDAPAGGLVPVRRCRHRACTRARQPLAAHRRLGHRRVRARRTPDLGVQPADWRGDVSLRRRAARRGRQPTARPSWRRGGTTICRAAPAHGTRGAPVRSGLGR